MLNYLRIAVAILSLTACGLLIALWVRSYWWDDVIGGPILWPGGCSLASTRGRLLLSGIEPHDPITTWEFLSINASSPYAIPKDFFGPVFALNLATEDGAYIHVPHWFPAAIAAAVTIILAKRWRFSLRALLIATTLVAVVLGLIVAAT
jgi:hypothetical protein